MALQIKPDSFGFILDIDSKLREMKVDRIDSGKSPLYPFGVVVNFANGEIIELNLDKKE